MKIRLKTIYAGPTGSFDAGTVRDFSDEEGQALVDAGYADELKPLAKLETAVLPGAPEVRLSSMNRAEIDAYGKAKGIDTSGASTKAEAIALIEAGPAKNALEGMTHDELVAEAAAKGVDISAAADDAAIAALLKAAV